MKKSIKKLLVIFILMVSYIIINLIFKNEVFAISQTTSTDINSIDSNQYPQIKEMIKSLQNEHPNWKFKILYTDITWSDAIANEYTGHGNSPRNLVPANNSNYDKEWICKTCGSGTVYDSGKWYCASESAIAYMMDVRNFLNSSDIFQFLELSRSENNRETIKAMVNNTFLNNESYINAILDAAQRHNVNAYYLVARMLQEQGRNGSTLSKGQGYNGQYIGYYNVFNIGASGSGKENVILNGLRRAEKEGWTTLESSIIGGAEIIAKSYIARGQNTLYLQKFDVDNSDGNLYWHQYMQNLIAAQNEGKTLKKTFEEIGSVNSAYTFIIPVFKNMPSTAVPRPSTTNGGGQTNVDLVKVNVTGSLYLRDEPKKSAKKIGSIYKDDIVTRLQKATEKVDGTYWDYIMTANGTRGYAARETFDYETTYKLYLVPLNPDFEEPGDEAVLKNEKIKLNTATKQAVGAPEATVKDFANLLGKEIKVKNSKGEILSAESKLSTGCTIDDIYSIAVLGDVNGDGGINSADLLAIQKDLLNVKKLETNSKQNAADVNQDKIINSADLLKIQKQLLGVSNIEI